MGGCRRVVDVFAGAGGLSEGFRSAGFEVVVGTDHDPDAAATYAHNFPSTKTVVGDIRDSKTRAAVLDAAQGADIVVGGPPCQAFSQVRNHQRLIADPRNSLYREFVRVVAATLPVAFVMENVPGLEQVGAKAQIIEDLHLEGEYRVMAQVVDAADYGVPQTRRRIIFTGIRRSLGVEPPLLLGTGAAGVITLARQNATRPARYVVEVGDARVAKAWQRRLANPSDLAVVTAEQAISDLRHLEVGRRADWVAADDVLPPESAYQELMRADDENSIGNTSVPRINGDTVMRLEGIPSGGNHRDLTDALLQRYLTGQRWGPDAGNGRLSRRHYYAYRRLHPAMWSWTLNTKADSVYHYATPRALSVREFARLQSFPDSFVFTTDPRKGELVGRMPGGAAHSRYRQVGNAVPPLLAKALAHALSETLESS